jgi:hypothetical protein
LQKITPGFFSGGRGRQSVGLFQERVIYCSDDQEQRAQIASEHQKFANHLEYTCQITRFPETMISKSLKYLQYSVIAISY